MHAAERSKVAKADGPSPGTGGTTRGRKGSHKQTAERLKVPSLPGHHVACPVVRTEDRSPDSSSFPLLPFVQIHLVFLDRQKGSITRLNLSGDMQGHVCRLPGLEGFAKMGLLSRIVLGMHLTPPGTKSSGL
jgi:hypothetical protein